MAGLWGIVAAPGADGELPIPWGVRLNVDFLKLRFDVLISWLVGDTVLAANIVRDGSRNIIDLIQRLRKVSDAPRPLC